MAKLYIGNLSGEVTDNGLQELFRGKGFQVTSARVICDREGGRWRVANDCFPESSRAHDDLARVAAIRAEASGRAQANRGCPVWCDPGRPDRSGQCLEGGPMIAAARDAAPSDLAELIDR